MQLLKDTLGRSLVGALLLAALMAPPAVAGDSPPREPGRAPAGALLPTHGSAALPPCTTTVVANVVALDQVLVWNKFGSRDPWGMMFALRRDVVSQGGGTALEAGNVRLRSNLRPRPLTLRVNVGECLEVRFTNLLDPTQWSNDTPATRTASFHVNGMPHLSIGDYGVNVGANANPLASP
ncbi:MAG: hypothetical protein RIT25_799, partial [Planctomycetota bacterium]